MSIQQKNKSGLSVIGFAMITGLILIWVSLMFVVENRMFAWVATGVVAGIDIFIFLQIKRGIDENNMRDGGGV